MSSFILYTYQCYPITVLDNGLFGHLPPMQERMDKKLEYIHSIITNSKFKFRSKQTGEFNHKIYYDAGGIIVLKIANNKYMNLEENFMKKEHNYFPSCFIIMDNRNNIQRIAIEEDITAFSSTNVVMNIIEYSLRCFLQEYGLNIELKKEYEKKEFWNLIKNQTKGISMVRFCFSYPNLPRVHQSINDLINSESKVVHSKHTTLEYRTDESEQLELKESNIQLSGLVDASASSGHPITIKVKGIRSFIKTGNTTKRIYIDDLEANLREGDDLFQNTSAKIIEALNSVK